MTAHVLRTPINTVRGILASRDLDNTSLGDGFSNVTLVSDDQTIKKKIIIKKGIENLNLKLSVFSTFSH